MNNLIYVVVEIATFITAIGVIVAFLKKWLEKQFKPIGDKIDNLDINHCRCYLVDFLSDVENGIPKNDIQKQRAYELYDHYICDLKGNSYIHDKWEKIMK